MSGRAVDSNDTPVRGKPQLGSEPGSDGGQTGVRRGSDGGQTGVRPGSDESQPRSRKLCDRETMKSSNRLR